MRGNVDCTFTCAVQWVNYFETFLQLYRAHFVTKCFKVRCFCCTLRLTLEHPQWTKVLKPTTSKGRGKG